MLTTSTRSVRLALCAVLAIVLAGGCAQQRGPGSASDPSQTSASPWALPTSTMLWNEHAWDLIARNQIGPFPLGPHVRVHEPGDQQRDRHGATAGT